MEKELLTKEEKTVIGVAMIERIEKLSEELAWAINYNVGDKGIASCAKRLNEANQAYKALHKLETKEA